MSDLPDGPSWRGVLSALSRGDDLDADDTAWAMDEVMAGNASPHEVEQAREAAIAALYGAAKELTELPGDDRSAQEIFRTVASTRDGAAVAARDSVTFPGDTPGVRF